MKKFWKATGIGAAWACLFLFVQVWVTLAGMLMIVAGLVHQEGTGLLLDGERFMELYLNSTTENLTAVVLVSNLLSIALVWCIFRCRHKSFSREIGLVKTSGRNLALAVLFGIGVSFTVDMLTGILPIPENMMEQFETEHEMLWQGSTWITIASVALAGPVSEELFFRGLCYTRLKKGMRPWAAALISAVFFGLAHGDPVWFLVGFAAGLALSWIFETTGSLWTAILVHVTNNAISTLYSYIAVPESINFGLTLVGVAMLIVSAHFLSLWNRKPTETAQISV